jgi:hypothetical protein
LDFDTFNAAEQARATAFAKAVSAASDKFAAEVAKAEEQRDAALKRANDDDLAARDANEKAFNDARQKERDDIVAAANKDAGLGHDGKAPKAGKAKKAPAA